MGSESTPTKTLIGWAFAGSPRASSMTSGVTTSVTYLLPWRPSFSKGETLLGPPDTYSLLGGVE